MNAPIRSWLYTAAALALALFGLFCLEEGISDFATAIGDDGQRRWVWGLVVAGGGIVLFLAAYRMITGSAQIFSAFQLRLVGAGIFFMTIWLVNYSLGMCHWAIIAASPGSIGIAVRCLREAQRLDEQQRP